MKSSSRRAALPMIALAALAAPQSVSAQAVGAYMRPGGGGSGAAPQSIPQIQPRPVPTQTLSPQPLQSVQRQTGSAQTYQRAIAPIRIDAPIGYSRGPAAILPDAAQQPFRAGGRSLDYRNNQNSGNFQNDSQYNPTRLTAPVGPANGFFNHSSDYSNGYTNEPVRITTPQGPQRFRQDHDENNYVYNTIINPTPIIAAAPPLLGGYYYGNYCDTYATQYTYPSVYSTYDGFPRFIFNPTVVVVGQPYYPVYTTSYLPFAAPSYPVTYNENNYYFTNEARVRDITAGGDRAKEALHNAYPADSYQAAFADIARAWIEGDVKPLRRHIKDTDTRLSVFLNKKYSYSIASGDLVQITRDAFDRLDTVSFDFTRLRKAKNGDVTAFGKHVYRVSDTSTGSAADSDGTVPFDQNGSDTEDSAAYDRTTDPASRQKKTVYVSYTLRHGDGKWYIIAVDSSEHSLVNVD